MLNPFAWEALWAFRMPLGKDALQQHVVTWACASDIFV